MKGQFLDNIETSGMVAHYILLKKIKGTLKQHLKSKNKKKVFNKIISFIQICDVLF